MQGRPRNSGRSPRTRRSNDRTPCVGLSQHFLRSERTAKRLIEASSITKQDLVIEAGPGKGALTAHLAAIARRVIAIELDRTLYEHLKDRFASTPNITLHHGDFLTHPLPTGAYSFFSNIPYARTAEIVRKLAFSAKPPENAYLIVQTAAAKRFIGLPFGPESAASLMIKVRFTQSLIAWLDPREFIPSPSVNSVLLRLTYRTSPLIHPRQIRQFDEFANTVFRSPGRSAMGRLRNLLTVRQARSLINELGFPATAPPSNIAFEHWLTVFKLIEWNRST